MAMDKGAVLLTGATGRIGSVLALEFAALGWTLALTCRDRTRAVALQQHCVERGAARVVLLETNLAEPDSIANILELLSDADLHPTTLINNARDRTHLARTAAGAVARSDFEGELRLGVVVPYELATALAHAPASALKTVVNISSIYGITPPQLRLYEHAADAPPESYGVAKAALIHLTKELAVRMAPRVRVNAISFGGVTGRVSESFLKRYQAATPMSAMLTDDDLFGAVRFLATEDSRAITGHNLIVDGGWTLW